MLYNDHGFLRFRVDGDTDGESDARTLEEDDAGPGHQQVRSAPASQYASADDLSLHARAAGGFSSALGTPRSPSLAGFRAPSIHLQVEMRKSRTNTYCTTRQCRDGHGLGWLGLNEKYCGIVAEYCKTHTFHCP